jgi:hypothetical protein
MHGTQTAAHRRWWCGACARLLLPGTPATPHPSVWRHRCSTPATALTDGDVAVWALQHLVHALGPQRGAQRARDSLGGQDVGLDGLDAAHARLAALLLWLFVGGCSLVGGGWWVVGKSQAPAFHRNTMPSTRPGDPCAEQITAAVGVWRSGGHAVLPAAAAEYLLTLIMMKGRPYSSKANDMASFCLESGLLDQAGGQEDWRGWRGRRCVGWWTHVLAARTGELLVLNRAFYPARPELCERSA